MRYSCKGNEEQKNEHRLVCGNATNIHIYTRSAQSLAKSQINISPTAQVNKFNTHTHTHRIWRRVAKSVARIARYRRERDRRARVRTQHLTHAAFTQRRAIAVATCRTSDETLRRRCQRRLAAAGSDFAAAHAHSYIQRGGCGGGGGAGCGDKVCWSVRVRCVHASALARKESVRILVKIAKRAHAVFCIHFQYFQHSTLQRDSHAFFLCMWLNVDRVTFWFWCSRVCENAHQT